MSDALWLAIISAVHEWGSGIINNMGAISAAVIALGTFVMQVWSKWSDRKTRLAAEAARAATIEAQNKLTAKIEENTALTQTAVLTKEHAELMAKGAERHGVVLGQEIERKRSSGWNPLATDTGEAPRP